MPDWYKWLAERTARFRRLPVHTRRYLLQVMLYLFVARLALWTMSFRRLTWFFEQAPRQPRDTFVERQRIAAVSRFPYMAHRNEITGIERERLRTDAWWLTGEADRFLPGETTCFARAIAAQIFLRRLGMGTTLYYGAATLPERGLIAHVWLQDGNELVVGHSGGQDYHILARYPEAKGG